MYYSYYTYNSYYSQSCLQDEASLRIKTESPYGNYDTSVHKFERCKKSSDNLPACISTPTPTPHPSRRLCAALFSLSDWSAVTFRSEYRFLITVLVDQKIKIPAKYCLEDEVVMLFDSCFTFESKLWWHRLFFTVESTRGIRALVLVFELLEEMVRYKNVRFCHGLLASLSADHDALLCGRASLSADQNALRIATNNITYDLLHRHLAFSSFDASSGECQCVIMI